MELKQTDIHEDTEFFEVRTDSHFADGTWKIRYFSEEYEAKQVASHTQIRIYQYVTVRKIKGWESKRIMKIDGNRMV